MLTLEEILLSIQTIKNSIIFFILFSFLFYFSGQKSTNAVQFSARGTSDIDVTIRRASQLPGVGQYQISSSPTSLRQSGKLNLNLLDISVSSENNSTKDGGDVPDNMSVNSGTSRSGGPPLLSPLISPTVRLKKQSSKLFRSEPMLAALGKSDVSMCRQYVQ